MTGGEFNWDDLEKEFSGLDEEIGSDFELGRAPWLQELREAVLEMHHDECTSDEPERCDEELERRLDEEAPKLEDLQRMIDLEVSVIEGERAPMLEALPWGTEDQARYRIEMNESGMRLLSSVLQEGAEFRQGRLMMAGTMAGLGPEEILAEDLDGLSVGRILDFAFSAARILAAVGSGQVEAVPRHEDSVR